MTKEYAPIRFKNGKLSLLDQRKLPIVEEFLDYETLEGGFMSIKEMVVRGAPCIGFTGIYSVALWLKNNKYSEKEFIEATNYLKTSRPTAVNLMYEVDRAAEVAKKAVAMGSDPYEEVVKFGHEQVELSEKNNRAMAQAAYEELKEIYGDKKLNILTHCNTGFLACGSIGTALGVVQHLGELDKIENVWVDETRPYLQGSRLTAYELGKLGIPHNIVVEGAASHLMSKGMVDAIFVGADRIVANGDTANKIGTANLSIIAKYYNVPFYVVAPMSSFDLNTPTGAGIEIELRPEEEILKYKENQIAPLDSKALNPSFDVSVGDNVTGIICEKGMIKPDYVKNIAKVFNESN